MKLLAFLTAAAAAAALMAAPSQARLTRDARTLLHASRTLSPKQELRLANRTVWTGQTALRFLSTHPQAGSHRSRARLRRDASWLIRLGSRSRADARARLTPPLDQRLVSAFACIHHYEGAWNANTGNGYYGGLQMDASFMSLYGSDFVRQWGTADNWPPRAQLEAAIRAYKSGRGFYPWPSTARACGLI